MSINTPHTYTREETQKAIDQMIAEDNARTQAACFARMEREARAKRLLGRLKKAAGRQSKKV